MQMEMSTKDTGEKIRPMAREFLLKTQMEPDMKETGKKIFNMVKGKKPGKMAPLNIQVNSLEVKRMGRVALNGRTVPTMKVISSQANLKESANTTSQI